MSSLNAVAVARLFEVPGRHLHESGSGQGTHLVLRAAAWNYAASNCGMGRPLGLRRRDVSGLGYHSPPLDGSVQPYLLSISTSPTTAHGRSPSISGCTAGAHTLTESRFHCWRAEAVRAKGHDGGRGSGPIAACKFFGAAWNEQRLPLGRRGWIFSRPSPRCRSVSRSIPQRIVLRVLFGSAAPGAWHLGPASSRSLGGRGNRRGTWPRRYLMDGYLPGLSTTHLAYLGKHHGNGP